MTPRRIVPLLVAFLLLVAACGGSGGEEETTTTTTMPSETTTTAGDTTTTTTEGDTTTTTAGETTTTSTTGAPGDPAQFAAALEASAAATSGRMEGSFAITGVEGSGDVTFGFAGAFDNAAGVFQYVMDLSGLAAAAGDDIPPQFQDAFGEMEIRQIGDTAYMRFPFFQFLGATTEWVRLPAEDTAETTGAFAMGGVVNPTELLGAFAGPGVTVEELGSEDVRGTATTHYRVVADMQAIYDGATPEEQAAIDAQQIPFDEVPIDIWIGDDGLVRRYAMEILAADSGFAPGGGGFATMSYTMELYDYGAAIDVAEPPADQITDLDQLAPILEPGG